MDDPVAMGVLNVLSQKSTFTFDEFCELHPQGRMEPRYKLEEYFEKVDANYDGTVNEEEVMRYLKALFLNDFIDHNEAFSGLSGWLEREGTMDLETFMSIYQPRVAYSQEQCERFFAETDQDMDGQISLMDLKSKILRELIYDGNEALESSVVPEALKNKASDSLGCMAGANYTKYDYGAVDDPVAYQEANAASYDYDDYDYTY